MERFWQNSVWRRPKKLRKLHSIISALFTLFLTLLIYSILLYPSLYSSRLYYDLSLLSPLLSILLSTLYSTLCYGTVTVSPFFSSGFLTAPPQVFSSMDRWAPAGGCGIKETLQSPSDLIYRRPRGRPRTRWRDYISTLGSPARAAAPATQPWISDWRWLHDWPMTNYQWVIIGNTN